MRVGFPADLHLGHANIIKFCQRPFLSSEEQELAFRDSRGDFRLSEATVRRHDDALLEAINSRVAESDILWIVGDFCWGQLIEATEYRNRIRCRVEISQTPYRDRLARPLRWLWLSRNRETGAVTTETSL
jgi:calcineurin-like phosphoesterase family protein